MYGGHAYAIGLGNLSHALAFNDTGINAKPLRFGQSVQRVPEVEKTFLPQHQLLHGFAAQSAADAFQRMRRDARRFPEDARRSPRPGSSASPSLRLRNRKTREASRVTPPTVRNVS